MTRKFWKGLIIGLIIVLPFWLWVGSKAFGATVYVKKIAGTIYYDNAASSCDDVTDADTASDLEGALVATGSDGVCNICAGTYVGTDLDSADGLDTTHIMTINAVGGTVIIDGTGCGDRPFDISHAITLNGPFTIGGADGTYYNIVSADATFNDITFDDDNKLLQIWQSSSIYNRCTFKNSEATIAVHLTGTSDADSVTMNACMFLNNTMALGIYHGTTHYFNNCNWVGNDHKAILSLTGAQNTVLRNCLFSGNISLSYPTHLINNVGVGTFTVSHSLLHGHPSRALTDGYGLNNVTDGGNNIFTGPLIIADPYRTIVPLIIDDYSNFAHWKDIADYALTKDMYIVYAVDQTHVVTPGDWASMADYVAQGHEIQCHTRHHPDLADRDAFTVTYDGTPATITFDINYFSRTGTFSTSVTGGSGTSIASKDLTAAAYDTVGELCTYINAQAGYTCTEDYASNRNDNALTITLTDQSNTDITGAGGDIDLDQINYFNEEITLSKSDIESNIPGYTCQSFTYPFDSHDEAARDALKEAGFLGASGRATDTSFTLSDLEIYQVRRYDASSNIGTTDDTGGAFTVLNAEARISALANRLGQYGGIVGIYDHSAGSYSLANWQTIIDALMYTNAEVITFASIFDEIRNSGNWVDADGDGERWTRTFTDNSDYRLKYASPCKDTGVDLGNGLEYGIHPNTGDAVDQDSYGSGWEIGVYVHDSTTTLGADDTHSYSLIPVQGGLHAPEGATGCNIVNDGIPGTLDLDETVDVTNTWVTTVDLAGIGAGEVVLAYNCGFVESQAAINATLGAGGTFTPDAECQFSITVGDCFTDYAGADYTIPITSPFVDAGEAHAVARVDLPGNPLCSWFDIGCYEYQDGVDVIKYYLRADGTAAYAESKGPCGTVGNCMTIATHDACTYSGTDVLYLCDDGGVFRDQLDVPSSGSAGSVITYKNETGDTPIISGADVVETWTYSGPTGDMLDIDFEADDLAEFDSSVTDGGDLSTSASASMGYSTYGMQAVMDDDTSIYGAKSISWTSSDMRVRFYIDPNGLTNGVVDDLFNIAYFSVGGSERAGIYMKVLLAGGYEISARFRKDDMNHETTAGYSISDAPHYIEFHFQRASSNIAVDGFLNIYIDGALQGGVANLDVYDITKPTLFEIGPGKGVSGINDSRGTLYIDDIIIMDSAAAIGPNYTNTFDATLATECPIVWVDDAVVTKGSAADSLADHEWFWAGNKLYFRDDTGDPDGSIVVEAGQRTAGIYISGKDYITVDGIETKNAGLGTDGSGIHSLNTSSNIVLTDIVSHDNRNHGILITATTDVTITSCDTYNQHLYAGIGFWNAVAQTVTAIVSECNTYDNEENGLLIEASDSVTVQTSKIYNNGNENIDISNSDSAVIKYCSIYGAGQVTAADGHGIALGNTSTGSEFLYNLIFDNLSYGIYIGAGSHKTYNCSFYNNSARQLRLTSNDNIVKNCIMEESGYRSEIRIDAGVTGSDVDYNTYYHSGGVRWTINVTDYNTIGDWRTNSLQDDNSVESDPLFKDAAGDDFTLKRGSPCIGAGTIPTGFETTYPLDPRATVLSPWGPVVANTDLGLREIGAYAFLSILRGPFGLSLGFTFD